MARRYARDSRGRFSSTGATSRGKRLGGKGGAPAARTSGSSAPRGTIAKGSVNRSIASLRGQAGGTTVTGNRSGSQLWKGRQGQAVRAANRVAAKINATRNIAGAPIKQQISAATARRAADYLTTKATTGKEPARRRGGLTSNANLVKARDYTARKNRKANPVKPAKMGKKAANPAQQKYRAATSQVRELKMYRGGKTDATVKAAAAKVRRMESKRMASGSRKRKG